MRKRAVKIVKNLTSTINKLENVKDRIVKEYESSSIFSSPSVSKAKLEQKRNTLITKYNIKKEEYGATESEGQSEP
jgi:hypothetical protein